MTQGEFTHQISRLREQFGAQAYGTERAKILWQEVKDFSDHWFKRVVDELLGCCRHAPLMPEFREHISRERERMREIEKKRHRQEAHEFMSTYTPEQLKLMVKDIIALIESNREER